MAKAFFRYRFVLYTEWQRNQKARICHETWPSANYIHPNLMNRTGTSKCGADTRFHNGSCIARVHQPPWSGHPRPMRTKEVVSGPKLKHICRSRFGRCIWTCLSCPDNSIPNNVPFSNTLHKETTFPVEFRRRLRAPLWMNTRRQNNNVRCFDLRNITKLEISWTFTNASPPPCHLLYHLPSYYIRWCPFWNQSRLSLRLSSIDIISPLLQIK